MKICQCCDTESLAEATTCSACGESSWTNNAPDTMPAPPSPASSPVASKPKPSKKKSRRQSAEFARKTEPDGDR